MNNAQVYARIGKITAFVTFALATVLFSLYYFTGHLNYGIYGYLFFLFALPINFILFIFLVIKSRKCDDSRKIHQSIGFMLLNFPVAILYFGIGIYFTGVMRMTIKNTTGNDIKNIKIIGCEKKELPVLKNGESESVWIDINGDCSISLSYIDVNGKLEIETVIGYVCSGMGQKIVYSIGQGEAGW
jgi:hypothetical protein